ncbi:MAG: endolytic transglycosylase MltG [Candidatus Sungbacteria bacterium]|uniref:Endolytic murein transglycosylase n=1 Tax=Candidatus Sungiibacteriota bacterium TaxID=2750080 RepID=A0A933DS26_9BACT|nr:endolytic transglycosylase MltG [Candidatus Sungbacteria bacterium]
MGGFRFFGYDRPVDELIRELKQQGVLRSSYVEQAFRAIDRKDFVRPEHRAEAYANYPLPIGEGQTISQPYTVAFMLDLLDPRPGERILDVGTGSGWQTALLAHIVSQSGKGQKAKDKGTVYAVERSPELCRFAKANLEKYNFIKNGVVEFFCQDATAGLPEGALFDKIIAAAAAEDKIPEAWRRELAIGGKIVAPVGDSIWCYTKTGRAAWEEQEFPGFAFVPLISTPPQESPGGNSGGALGRRRTILPFLAISFLLLFSGTYSTFAPTRLAAKVRIEIPPGSGSRAIGAVLKSNGVIRSRLSFVTYAALTGSADALKPGRYEFSGKIAIPELVDRLVRGEIYPNERLITIPEGWDVRDIGGYLESVGMFPAAEWWETVGRPAGDYRREERLPRPDFSQEFGFLKDKPGSVGLEGYLFPDTYRVFRTSSADAVTKKMLENFDAKFTPELRAETARQKKTIFAVITMASLLEKEVPTERDRAIVSGILWKRFGLGIPLQVDATINYITGRREEPSAADLAIDSPYNTYRYPGLPLGPIANPGMEAIRAALFPRASDYLYYLSAADGTTIFSRTLEEHAAAKRKFLQ